ncbi:ribosome maturation factor RimP [Terriglobus sp.]|uniref:ribosome maturation factor RimP n=1 Tax=Terriglobus sp. TaxID=1889013 RepID=UPI003AFF98C2
MAVSIESVRALAERIAARHGLELVDAEFTGAGKQRALRIFLEKDEAGRAELKRKAAEDATCLPSGVPIEALSGVTHEDCAAFAQDFGTVLDVEDLIPGTAEYTLEVSSPGIERKLYRPADYQRFSGFLAEVRTFQPVHGSKKLTGRMSFADDVVTLDLSAVKPKGKKKKGVVPAPENINIPLRDIEQAQLVAEL